MGSRPARWLLLLAAMAATSCGYRWTGPASAPEGVGTRLSIPLMTNRTTENLAAEIFTEALREEAVRRGSFTIDSAAADSLWRGTLQRIEWKPVSYGEDGRTLRLTVEAELELVWTDTFDRELGRWRDHRSLDYAPGPGGAPLLTESARLDALRQLSRLLAAAAYDDLTQGF